MSFQALLAPLTDDAARRAFVGIAAIALGAGPVGVFLMLRRMALMGDTMAHAILPGVAIGFLLAGTDSVAMSIGGLIAGLIVAVLTGVVARVTHLKEDASLAALFLISLALGVAILSVRGGDDEIVHVLFGDAASLNGPKLLVIAGVATISLVALALVWRPLVMECVDPLFLRSVSGTGGPVHIAFLALVVLNLVAAFQAMGTLLAVGLMMLPAITARFWARDITALAAAAVVIGIVSGYVGLVVAAELGAKAGPAVILVAGVIYIASVLFGRVGGIVWRAFPGRHLEA
jgi:zinc/manganese transport system permease protein